ncbi:MAG: cupin domain-containing protein [Pyrinomonadaceae bacterium]|nr:cupin domain-containing protein [Pyrinomonadaceae bacterium]
MKYTIDEMMGQLPLPPNEKWKDGVWDLEILSKGNVRLEFFAPKGVDYQTYHDEDEFYFIVRGSGDIIIGEETFPFETGDALFVPARIKHHFENFTDDLATWAVFF